MWERPQPELFLGDLPQPRQPVRLDDEKEDDEPAEDHALEVGQDIDWHREPEPQPGAVEEEGQQDYERGAEERAEDAAKTPDDHHEQDLYRAAQVGIDRLDAA